MADRSRDVERMIFLRREAEKIVRELFQPEGAAAAAGSVRVVADLRTDGDQYVLEVELPGVVAGRAAGLRARRRARRRGAEASAASPPDTRPAYDRAERDFGSFRRVFDLPGPADLSKTEASLRGGLSCIRVPRIVDRRGRPRPIKVQLADGEGS